MIVADRVTYAEYKRRTGRGDKAPLLGREERRRRRNRQCREWQQKRFGRKPLPVPTPEEVAAMWAEFDAKFPRSEYYPVKDRTPEQHRQYHRAWCRIRLREQRMETAAKAGKLNAAR